jgi:hypothetical protein
VPGVVGLQFVRVVTGVVELQCVRVVTGVVELQGIRAAVLTCRSPKSLHSQLCFKSCDVTYYDYKGIYTRAVGVRWEILGNGTFGGNTGNLNVGWKCF